MKKIVIGCIHIYQHVIAPLLHSRCRFQPSCSQYAIYAIETNGVIKGLILTVRRVLRCRPTVQRSSKNIGVYWGYDPVPAQPPKNVQPGVRQKGR